MVIAASATLDHSPSPHNDKKANDHVAGVAAPLLLLRPDVSRVERTTASLLQASKHAGHWLRADLDRKTFFFLWLTKSCLS